MRVPAENMLGEVNQGFYGIMNTFQDERMPKSSPELRGVLTGLAVGTIGWTFGGP
jgi:alkylation response protein AidB-like acyl-CoA dehydrogenase